MESKSSSSSIALASEKLDQSKEKIESPKPVDNVPRYSEEEAAAIVKKIVLEELNDFGSIKFENVFNKKIEELKKAIEDKKK